VDQHLDSSAALLRTFRRLSDYLERGTTDRGSDFSNRKTIVLVDQIDFSQLNPIEGPNWETLIAMLILAFPEVQWVFGLCSFSAGNGKQSQDLIASHGIQSLFSTEYEPLFDPTGLRNWVRTQANSERPITETDRRDKSPAPYIPFRKCVAAAIDDEQSYAYFHAYTAYRFGFRSHVVTTDVLFESLFSANDVPANLRPQFNLVFDDLFLNFPDREFSPQVGLSHLRHRGTRYPRVAEADHWIFVTTGQRRPRDEAKWADNTDYLSELRHGGQHNETIFKPTSGIFDLWERSGLLSRLPGALDQDLRLTEKKPRCGYAEGFFWPPEDFQLPDDPDPGHSAPGRLLEIVTSLVARAERLLPDAKSVEEGVHGALLAAEALELIGPRTPTTALEALALKHQFEVMAECQFYGVEYDFDLQKRFDEIELELASVGRWFNPKTRDNSILNAQLSVISRLVIVFREANQFDEEQACMIKVRDLHRRTWVSKNRWRRLAWPFRWYVEFLLKSLTRFSAAIGLWLVVLTVLYALSSNLPSSASSMEKLGKSFTYAYTSFFPMQPPQDPDPTIKFNFGVVALAIFGGFVHLGVFVSHLYSKITRR